MAILKPSAPKSDKELALEAAKAAGLVVGEWYSNLKLCRHQIANHPTYLWAEGVPQAGWHARIIVSVKNPASWKPVNPPHDTLSARFTGTAQVDGTLKFESQDICRAARYRRSR
jgi:hypothetical protein